MCLYDCQSVHLSACLSVRWCYCVCVFVNLWSIVPVSVLMMLKALFQPTRRFVRSAQTVLFANPGY